MKKYIIFGGLLIGLMMYSCSGDSIVFKDLNCPTEPVTYSNQIRPLLLETCGYVGCHNGEADRKDYSHYIAIKSDVESSDFAKRVFDLRDMPPPSYTPQDRPQNLTAEQLDLLKCWIEQGHPE